MSKQRVRAWGAVMTVCLAVSGLGACGLGPRHTVEDQAALGEEISAVRLDSDSGGVTVHGRPGTSGATLARSIESPSESTPGPTHRVEGGTLVLSGCGQYCSVNYTVTVPPGLPVSGGTSTGAVTVNGVGSVDVGTSSGAVTLDGVAGPTRVETTNGAVRGTGIEGDSAEVRTSNGEIDLTLQAPQDVRAETGNGRITLTVPAGSYRVGTHTSNGDQQIAVPDDPSGVHGLDLRTSNGAITVRPS